MRRRVIYIQGDSEGKVSILGGASISHSEKKNFEINELELFEIPDRSPLILVCGMDEERRLQKEG